jgi:hypothetical protein
MNDPLKGQPSGRLPRIVDKPQVESLLNGSRRRFAPKAVWLIVALETEEINENGKRALKDGFHEFSLAGGEKLVIVAKNVLVVDILKLLARRVGILDVEIVDTIAIATKVSGAYWDLHNPRPAPSK